MDTRKLGAQGLEVSEQGLGCMGMSEFHGKADEREALLTIERAPELGVILLFTADVYGALTDEHPVDHVDPYCQHRIAPPSATAGERYPDMSTVEPAA